MTSGEANGLKKYLVGVGVLLTGALVIQSGMLWKWQHETSVHLQYMQQTQKEQGEQIEENRNAIQQAGYLRSNE